MPFAQWLPHCDVEAGMTNSEDTQRLAQMELDIILAEIDTARRQSIETADISPNELATGPDILNEIPVHDVTYQSISSTLIPHLHIPEMYLLEFRTFAGSLAFQPCSRNIDLLGVLEALRPLDGKGDSLFRAARDWSCIVQAMPTLPKEVRWVLATVYNFASEMLRPEHHEDSLWNMRQWLLYWYDVAHVLFDLHNIKAWIPEPDWFMRPLADSLEPVETGVHLRARNTRRTQLSDSADETESVIRRSPQDSLFYPSEEDHEKEPPLMAASPEMIHWLNEQPVGMARPSLFDPTPGGPILRNRRQSQESTCRSSFVNASQLNPLAPDYVPLQAKHEGTDLIQRDSSSSPELEDLFELCSNVSAASDTSERHISAQDRENGFILPREFI